MTSVTDALGWMAGAFYVIVSLSIVYLFFFKIVPNIIGGAKDIWSLLRGIVVLAALAVLLACVAVITADWIFSQVLDSLPRTRMAREIDRVTGSLIRLSIDSPYSGSTANAGPYLNTAPPGSTGGNLPLIPGSTVEPSYAPAPNTRLKAGALEEWARMVQNSYNSSGKLSDNTNVMAKRDVPQGVVCDIANTGNAWYPKAYEEWRLVCSMDNFRTSVLIQVNGVAARGLTGGDYYAPENPFTLYGAGMWPPELYEPIPSGESAPDAAPTPAAPAPQGGPLQQGTPEAPARVHKVRPGESLAMIASKYNLPVSKLVAANQQSYPQLKANPNVIVVGWVLAIPE